MQREPHPPSFGHDPRNDPRNDPRRDPRQDPADDSEDGSTFVMRLGTVVGGGVLAATASSLPAVLRIGDGGSVLRAIEQWLALAALLTPLAVLVVAVLRRGRVGLRILVGDRGPLLAAAALWWAVLELGVLSIFGSVLRAKTHHHGLAGVTFAILALVTGLVVALLASRGVRMLLRMPPGGHRVALIVAASAAFVVVALVGIRTSRAPGLHTAAALVDSLALVVSAAIASTRAMSRWRPLAVAGVPVATALLLLGFVCMHAEPDLKEMFTEGAPVQAWVLGLF
jgi:hypothetical protein